MNAEDKAVEECSRFICDAVWSTNYQSTVQIEVHLFRGKVCIEMSNIGGSMCEEDELFEETAKPANVARHSMAATKSAQRSRRRNHPPARRKRAAGSEQQKAQR